MPIGLVIMTAVVMALAAPRIRLRLSVPVASRRARSPGLAAADVEAVTR
jgi:hypothetical protein